MERSKHMNAKRWMALFLALTLAITMLAGCTKKTETPVADPEQGQTEQEPEQETQNQTQPVTPQQPEQEEKPQPEEPTPDEPQDEQHRCGTGAGYLRKDRNCTESTWSGQLRVHLLRA